MLCLPAAITRSVFDFQQILTEVPQGALRATLEGAASLTTGMCARFSGGAPAGECLAQWGDLSCGGETVPNCLASEHSPGTSAHYLGVVGRLEAPPFYTEGNAGHRAGCCRASASLMSRWVAAWTVLSSSLSTRGASGWRPACLQGGPGCWALLWGGPG